MFSLMLNPKSIPSAADVRTRNGVVELSTFGSVGVVVVHAAADDNVGLRHSGRGVNAEPKQVF